MTDVVVRCLWQRRPAGGFTPPAPPVGYLCQNEFAMSCGATGLAALSQRSGSESKSGLESWSWVRDGALFADEVMRWV